MVSRLPISLLTIGMFYQNVWLNCSKWFIYLQLVFKSILKIFVLCTFNWYVLFIFNWYHDALNWYFFFNWYYNVLFWFHPLLIFFCLWQKGGEHYFIVFFDPFVDDWQKGGEVFVSLYACCEFICMFIGLFEFQFGIKNFYCFMLCCFVLLISRNFC